MFRTAEVGHKIEKEKYDEEVPKLREALLEAQFDVSEAKKFPVIILIGGVDGSGKGEIINLLNSWMDPRHLRAYALGEPNDEERSRPPMYRFWHRLPPKGKMGLFIGGWYDRVLFEDWNGKSDKAQLEVDGILDRATEFEQMLVEEGALILKFWLHLSKDEQAKRFKKLEKNPDTAWRVTKDDWKRHKQYDEYRKNIEYMIRKTSTGHAPWTIVEATDPRYRNLTIGKRILESLRHRLEQQASRPHMPTPPVIPSLDNKLLLQTLDFTQKLERDEYKKLLDKYQALLNRLTHDPRFNKKAVVLVFEGSDAAGKGGNIRRITAALDARQYRVIPIAAPTEEERAQPWLWRFWRHIPRQSQVTIFDRSWYGRVLVERVEGFCSEADWNRAYSEINNFEQQLAAKDFIVVKFWISITKEEQLRRFEERQQTGFKRYKITDEDWRNRDKWDAYEVAVNDMIERTSTNLAPWHLVEGNDKYFARIKVLKLITEAIEKNFRQD